MPGAFHIRVAQLLPGEVLTGVGGKVHDHVLILKQVYTAAKG
jgi:hypothetical protein